MSLWCIEIKYNKKGASDELDEEINYPIEQFLDKYGEYIETLIISEEED